MDTGRTLIKQSAKNVIIHVPHVSLTLTPDVILVRKVTTCRYSMLSHAQTQLSAVSVCLMIDLNITTTKIQP